MHLCVRAGMNSKALISNMYAVYPLLLADHISKKKQCYTQLDITIPCSTPDYCACPATCRL